MKDLESYLGEAKKDTKKAHHAKKGEKADDKKYIALMVKYKKLRRGKGKEEANKVLREALKLAREGEVSDKVKVGTAYL